MKWAALPQGKYIIEGMRELSTQYGDAIILTLTAFEDLDDTIEVWTCERLREQIKNKHDFKYVRNNGLKLSQKNKTHSYYSFDLL